MRQWDWNLFTQNNKKLNNYLNNVENAIVLLSANDIAGVKFLSDVLRSKYRFELIDYENSKKHFVRFLNRYACDLQSHRLCLYTIHESKTDTYDLTKTLNLSRELLRKIGVLVIIAPVYLVCKNPVKPIYSEELKYFLPKKIVQSRRSMVQNSGGKESNCVAAYMDLLERYTYKAMRAEDVQFVEHELYYEVLEKVRQQIADAGGTPDDYYEIQIKLYQKTAGLYVRQAFFSKACALYEEICYISSERTNVLIRYLEANQGKAYCLYSMGKYEEAKNVLVAMLDMTERINNVSWKCKIYNI